jgi:predicted negative regulator of RcsB-dependent stress response
MRRSLNQTGSSHMIVIVAAVVIAAVGYIGFRVSHRDTQVASTQTAASQHSDIKNSNDVRKANDELTKTNVDSINPDQLDTDLSVL